MLFAMNQGGRRNSNIWRARQVPNQTFAWRSNHWPIIKESVFSFVAPSISLHSFRPLKGFLTPLQRPITSWVASGTAKKQGHSQVCALGAEVPGHPEELTIQTLIVYLFLNTFVSVVPINGKGRAPPPQFRHPFNEWRGSLNWNVKFY